MNKVGYFCNVVPEEIITACGAEPARLCSQDCGCAETGGEMLSGDICPVVKSICGAAADGRYAPYDLLVVPGACDGKTKCAEILATYKDIFFLDLPRDGNYLVNADVWTEKYTRFFDFLKARYRVKAGRKELLRACGATNRRAAVFRELVKFRAEHPRVISASEYFAAASESFTVGVEDWTARAEQLLADARVRAAVPFGGKRVLLAGAPVISPAFKILDILEGAGCDVAADTVCSAYGRLYDPVEIDEDTETGILRALSLKYIAGSLCPCFLNAQKLINRVIDAVKEYNLDGVIYYNLRLCTVFDMQTPLLRRALKERHIPFLALKTDLGKEDRGQLLTRVEAFLEMLR